MEFLYQQRVTGERVSKEKIFHWLRTLSLLVLFILLSFTTGAQAQTFYFLNEDGTDASVYLEESRAYVRIIDATADQTSGVDQVTVTLTTDHAGDWESLDLTETSGSSGVFEGSINIVSGAASANGALETSTSAQPPFRDVIRGDYAGVASNNVEIVGSILKLTDAQGFTRFDFVTGETLYIHLQAPLLNDPLAFDQASVQWTGLTNGDVETVFLNETAIDSGIFTGQISSDTNSPALDGVLNVSLNESIEAVHANADGLDSSLAGATMTEARVDFLRLTGDPASVYPKQALLRVQVIDLTVGDPTMVDSLSLHVEGLSGGDSVSAFLTETSTDSGIYDGRVRTDDMPSSSGDIILTLTAGETVRATYWTMNGSATDQAQIVNRFAPVAYPDYPPVQENTPTTFDSLANDSHPDSEPLTFVAYTQPEEGSLVLNPDGTFTYTPNPGVVEEDDRFDYIIEDPHGGQAESLVLIYITPQNEPPVANPDAATAPEDQAVTLDVLANDFDPEFDFLSVELASLPAHGMAVVNLDRTITYTPEPNFFGSDSFTYTIQDDADNTASATVSITVQSVNDPPTASFVANPTTGTTPFIVNFFATASSDVDDGIASYSWDFGDGATGTGSDVDHTYTSAGTFTATLTVTDASGASDTASATIQVTSVSEILFVVLDRTNLGAGDSAVLTRLQGTGSHITLLSQGESQSSDADGKDLVIISSTVTSSQVNSKFRDVSVPVLLWEPWLLDDMRMADLSSNVDFGSADGQNTLDILDAAHPMAAGLSGSVMSNSAGERYTWGHPGTSAIIVAAQAGNNARAMIFGYEAATEMVGLIAPARRVGFFLSDNTAASLTTDGWALFDEAVCWAVNCTGAPRARIEVDVTTGTAPLTINFNANPSTSTFPITQYAWDFGDGTQTSGNMGQYTYPTAGIYELSLTITDSQGQSSTAKTTVTVGSLSRVLLVSSSASLGVDDAAVKTRLEALGYAVDVVSQSASQSSDADGKALVLISSTINSSSVNSKFRDVTVPVITWEAWLYDDMKMTGALQNADYGRIDNQTTLTIADPSHPLAAGRSGDLSLVPGVTYLRWGVPSATASTVATVTGDASKALIFAYDTGDPMVGMNAPARRVGLPFADENPSVLNVDGWALFDAAVAWAVGP